MASTGQFLNTPERQPSGSFVVVPADAAAYQLCVTGGLSTGLSAGDTLYSFRTGSGSGVWVILAVRFSITQVLAFSATKIQPTELWAARAFTASDSGGLAATITGNNGKVRTDDPTTTIADLRICDTAGLTVGTRTLDAQLVHSTILQATTGVNISIINVTASKGTGDTPLVLAANEGFVLRAGVGYETTGNWRYRVMTTWYEMPSW